MKVSAIIVAAGSSSRMGFDKLFTKINGECVLKHSLDLFINNDDFSEVIVVTSEKNLNKVKELVKNTKVKVVPGGKERQDSVLNGVKASTCQYIAIHDAARPFASKRLIHDLLEEALKSGAAAPGVTPVCTIKEVNDNKIVRTIDRNKLVEIQTPQIFKKSIYLDAVSKFTGPVTDDCQILENAGYEVSIINGERSNIKLTTVEDFMPYRTIKIGNGYDVHKLVENRKLIIGGVEIPYDKGLMGHSDADVLLHAIMDSMLGAASLGDIGKIFPDNDSKYLNANSLKLLSEVNKIIKEKGYIINNIDSIIVAQEPKMAKYIDLMRNNIAKTLETDIENVSIKATTEEGLGFTGKKEGISAYSICILKSSFLT